MPFDFREELSKMTPLIKEGAKIIVVGCNIHFEMIRKQFMFLVGIDIEDSIDGFADVEGVISNKKEFHGRKIIDVESFGDENNVYLISHPRQKESWNYARILCEKGNVVWNSVFYMDTFLSLIMRWESERLQRFNRIHEGERCFIIGNGPSLTIDDLNRLINEKSFATNRISLLFGNTEWRPSYYCIADPVIFKQEQENIAKEIKCPVFFAYNSIFEWDEFCIKNGYFYYSDGRISWSPNSNPLVEFSENPLILYNGKSITYDCIQLAVFMGFKDIYLLGMDATFSMAVTRQGYLKRINQEYDHFSRDYKKMVVPSQCDMNNLAFKKARDYCESKGIRIQNATRGGKLEIFDRVDFDTLFM